jgi:Fe2+ or Zn2+ uptake regulation protein
LVRFQAVDDSDLHRQVAERLAEIDQRYTRGRRALVEVLATGDGPLTVGDITERDASLALSSAYRNLVVLEQAGVVDRIVTSDDYARFELTEDLGSHHHHLICSVCGEVRDFTISDQLEAELDKALQRVARRNDFDPSLHRLDLVGTCMSCR